MRSILSQVNDGLVQNKIWSKIQQNVKNNPVAETLYSWRFFLRVSPWSEKGRFKPVPSMLKKQAWRRTWTSCCSLYLFTNLQHEIKDCQRQGKSMHVNEHTQYQQWQNDNSDTQKTNMFIFDCLKGRTYVIPET